MNIRVIDDFLPDPLNYLGGVSRLQFSSRTVDGMTFHGIASDPMGLRLAAGIEALFPASSGRLQFFRKSPFGQTEPNDIHADTEMGAWTGILYLNENPATGDGTTFWRHSGTGEIEGDDWKADGHDRSKWMFSASVPAKFNRLLLFDAKLYHSRAIVENYGEGDDARLIQVIFGKGKIPWQ